jgi:branched-chain amino acid transport system ATP-binding protein
VAARGIGCVPQGRCNFPLMSVRENLELGGYILSGAAARQARERVLKQFPMLKAKLAVMARNLSGGEQQIRATATVRQVEPSCCCSTSRRWVCRLSTRT